jgi:flagellar assembly factor FliW
MVSPVMADQLSESELAKKARVIEFAHGLVGCESWCHFELQDDPEGGPVKLLQCLDDPNIRLLVVDPSVILTDYGLDLSESDAKLLELDEPADATVLCTLTIRHGSAKVTANLLGPLVINLSAGLGKQLVLANSGYSVHHPVLMADDAPDGGAEERA